VRPLTLDEIRPALSERYHRELDGYAEQTRIDQLRRWGESQPGSVQTQKTLGDLWAVSQGTVSSALRFLIQQGYVVALPRSGGEPIQYVLSGTSRLIFG
jgi:DNA-binding GntR family transcriptional regulator